MISRTRCNDHEVTLICLLILPGCIAIFGVFVLSCCFIVFGFRCHGYILVLGSTLASRPLSLGYTKQVFSASGLPVLEPRNSVKD